jgi:(S)-ureidoglycine aminohydrolase
MKKNVFFLFYVIPLLGLSQPDVAPRSSEVILSRKYDWQTPKDKTSNNILSTTILEGSGFDMAYVQMLGHTLMPAKKKDRLQVPSDEEHLLLIKSGELVISFNDSTWTIGPGSIALLMPLQKYSIKTKADKPCDYYVMKYRSRLPMDADRGKNAGGSIVRDWQKLQFHVHERGGVRKYFERPTAMCKRFEMHVTTLKEGLKSHDAHTHRAEEIVLIIENKTEMQIGDQFIKGKAGDLYYLGSNLLHGIKNDGEGMCSYFAYQFE